MKKNYKKRKKEKKMHRSFAVLIEGGIKRKSYLKFHADIQA